MGCKRRRRAFNCVRVIHMNGYFEDYEPPVTVGEVTGKPPAHVLLSSAHLLAFGSNPLRPDDRLESGRLYFLIPHSIFQSETSPLDLASLMTRLSGAARRGGAGAAPPSSPRRSEGQWCRERQMTARGTWKPELDPIEERSFGRSLRRDSMNSSMRSILTAETS
ncbi:uncharacterized protein LOC122034104 [Zingiber officinale]|uniref:Uncharacterized protein n=1 Tax=Zingiber officinale TaxID=94328 RepID=A0A8J5C7U9_ZINOF|nr:uncharacterized protein LOC122034104 [Zingiber officinale]KAG6469210.1 hypothetical protein ZIOFF_073915 [Zingiber officinale]